MGYDGGRHLTTASTRLNLIKGDLMAENMESIKGSVTIETFVDKQTQNGLYALINWLDGFEAKGGSVPGHFELVMYFRQMQNAIQMAKQAIESNESRT